MKDPNNPEKASLAGLRAEFNDETTRNVAKELQLPPKRMNGKGFSRRFAFFADDSRLVVVAGAQEGDAVELALAHAVRHADGRSMTLVLPEGHTNATRQRIPWLLPSARPSLYTHRAGHGVIPVAALDQSSTIQSVVDRLKGESPSDELTEAMAPLHLGELTNAVWPLVDRATRDRRLDHGHRQAERSWHFAGQRVLSIRRTKGEVSVRAGIQYSGTKAPKAVVLKPGERLTPDQMAEIQAAIEDAIEQRRNGPPPIHRPDEHWLQAVIRRDPSIVGVEQPALRELPAWRPRDAPNKWGRGFIDLVGLDGHGDIRIVETKLESNADDLLILQGLDYYVWAKAYQQALRDRLGATEHARFELHYVLGSNAKDDKIKMSPCTKPLAAALDPDAVQWGFQIVSDWFPPPGESKATKTRILEPFEVPSE